MCVLGFPFWTKSGFLLGISDRISTDGGYANNRTCVLVCPCCPCLKVWTDYLSKVIPLSGKFHTHKKWIQSNHKTVWPLACDVNHIRQFPSAPLKKNDMVCRRAKLSVNDYIIFVIFPFPHYLWLRLLYKKDYLCKDKSCLIIYQLLQVIYRQSGSNVKKTLEDLIIRLSPLVAAVPRAMAN